jgi:outer membrane protein assembly factor BamB
VYIHVIIHHTDTNGQQIFGEKKMKLQKNKTLSIVTLILLLTLTTFMASIPNVKPQVDTPVDAVAFVSVNPNPVGINQHVTVNMWISPLPRAESDILTGFTVTITNPNGNIETKGPYHANPNGGKWITFTPNIVGQYTFRFTYPGETFISGAIFKSATSPTITLEVQEQPIPPYPDVPLPTDYWTRPISSENRLWASISGDWLTRSYNASFVGGTSITVGGFNPYSQAPRAPHVMWTKEVALGGLVGGEQGTHSYFAGLSYDAYLNPPIIMAGKLYYNVAPRGDPFPGFVCVDLRTGQELWRNPTGQLSHGQLFNLQNFGVYTASGVVPLLWTKSWDAYNPLNGDLMFSFENASGIGLQSRPVFGEDGTMYAYLSGKGWLAMWNSSKAFIDARLVRPRTYYFPATYATWNPRPGTYDWTAGLQWNVTVSYPIISDELLEAIDLTSLPNPVIFGTTGNVLIARVGTSTHPVYVIGYDMTTGRELWVNDFTQAVWAVDATKPTYWHATGEEVWSSFSLNTMAWNGYDINTGNKLWVSDPQVFPWGDYSGYAPTIAYGKLYSLSYDGHVHAFDITTGEEVWKFSSGNSGIETVYGTWPFFYGPIIADGVAFAGTGYETPEQPLSRGNRLFAIDANSGEQLWNILGMMYPVAIADGYLVAVNQYDTRAYSFGKGPSATTVSTPDIAATMGDTVIIKGTVTDQSAGQPDTPAISDEDMGPWMEYLHMNQPFPADVTGVDVSIDVIDANGNFRNIGTATSNAAGTYSLVWSPDIPGEYTVIATFAGSESYGSSFDQTTMYVEQAPEPTPPPDATPAPMTDTYIAGSTIAILAGIAIAVFLILRKK